MGELTEKKRRMVEMRIGGAPVTRIMSELEVSRSTVGNWLKEPEVQAYYWTMVEHVDAARRARLIGSHAVTLELHDALVTRALELVQSPTLDKGDLLLLRDMIATVAEVVKKQHGLIRVDAGNPSEIVESRKAEPDSMEPRKRSKVERLLDQFGTDDSYDPSESAIAEKELNQ